jgi:hypothetical protein
MAIPRLKDGERQPVPIEGDRRLVVRGEIRESELACTHHTLRAHASRLSIEAMDMVPHHPLNGLCGRWIASAGRAIEEVVALCVQTILIHQIWPRARKLWQGLCSIEAAKIPHPEARA